MPDLFADGKTVTIVTIGPDEAAALLLGNEGNRPIQRRTVDRYVRQMHEGRWKFVGDPLRTDRNGHLIDGQHRLTAVIESGTTHKFLMLVGADRQEQTVMDVGAPRRAGQQFIMNGWKNGPVASAIARMSIRWEYQDLTANMLVPTLDEQVQWAHDPSKGNPALLEEACVLSRRIYDGCRIPQQSGGTVVHRLLVAADMEGVLLRDQVEEFVEALYHGADLAPDDPALVLRNYAQRMRYIEKRMTPMRWMWILLRTWRGWSTDERFTKIQMPKGGISEGEHLQYDRF